MSELPEYRILRAAGLVRKLLSALSTGREITQGNTTQLPSIGGHVFPDYAAQTKPLPVYRHKRSSVVHVKCAKCGKFGKVDRHHVTYDPVVLVNLCRSCHSRITSLNARAAFVAYTNKIKRKAYTNRVRLILWRWFMNNPWPESKRISKGDVVYILRKANFKIEKPKDAGKNIKKR